MSTGSEALNRTVNDWLGLISSGRLRLPSFQRGTAWDRRRVQSMIETIVRDLPLGITLVLHVGDEEKFHSRPLETAPETVVTVTEHLLDGQQRLTALWRALKDNNERESYFVHIPNLDDNPDNDDDRMTVKVQPVSPDGEGGRKPRWVDDPVQCLRQGLIPVRLLDPDHDDTDAWVQKATAPLEPGDDLTDIVEYKKANDLVRTKRDHLNKIIRPMRETVKHFNLPYLRLPASTPRDVALSVFVNMNTNARPLTAYDIIVAELENRTGRRLHEMVHALNAHAPAIGRYLSVSEAVLQTSALMQGKQPNQRGFYDMDLHSFAQSWDSMTLGLTRLASLLEESGILDAERVPSVVPLPVAAAILAQAAPDGDARAVADRLARRYLWSSFFTTRYENAAATRAAADYRNLRQVLDGTGTEGDVSVFDRTQYPLPTIAELMAARWPKSKRTLSRAVLATSTYFGARDFADDTKVSAVNIRQREYHHLFPDKLLGDAGIDSFLALNCALITWKTNRTIGRLDPIAYLEARADRAPDDRDVRDRLESHLVPYERLANAGPYPDIKGEELRAAVKPDFDAFLSVRAELVLQLATELCDGRQPHLRDVLDASAGREEVR